MTTRKYAMAEKVSGGPWTAYTAETINKLFERLYKATRLAANATDSIGALANNLDALDPQPGDLIVCTSAGVFALLPIVTTDQRVLTNNGDTPTWALVNLTNGVTGLLPFANLADVAATSVLGSIAGGSAASLTLTQVLDFIGSAAQGDILYRGAASWARLPADNAGKVLSTNGVGANPSWADSGTLPASAGLFGSSSFFALITNPTAGTYNQINLGGTNPSTALGTNALVIQSGEGAYQQYTTAATTDSAAGAISVSNPWIDWSYPFDIIFIIRTGALITNTRLWIGIAGSAATSSDTYGGGGSPVRAVAFRYSTVAGDGGWVGVNNDGTTQSNTATVAAIALSTRYKLRIRSTGSAANFSINGSAEISLGTNFPTGATRVGLAETVYTTTNSAKVIQLQRTFGNFGL